MFTESELALMLHCVRVIRDNHKMILTNAVATDRMYERYERLKQLYDKLDKMKTW